MNVIPALVLSLCISSFSQQLSKPSVTESNKKNPRTETQQNKSDGDKNSVRYEYQISEQHKKTQHDEDTDAVEKRLYHWYLWATIIGVGLSFGVLVMLILQNIWMRRAAIAATRSADALVASERAWIHVELVWSEVRSSREIDESEDYIFCSLLYSNKGKTPCWVFEKSIHVVVASSVTALPQEPEFGEANNARHIYETEPIYPTTPQRESRLRPKRPHKGREDMFFIYGVVKYRDIFMVGDGYRETRFGYMTNDLLKLERIIGRPKYNENA